jgi:glutamyl-tRNA synthetase
MIVTRFAPSPTGYLHIGGARTALFNYLFARRHGGRFLLRIEDTDRARSTEDAVRAIMEGLDWLGLSPDEPPVFQSQRAARHVEVAQALIDAGAAYYCAMTPEETEAERTKAREEGRAFRSAYRDREPADTSGCAVRFRTPDDGETVIEDAVQGRIVIANRQLDDLILLRADGAPTYMLAVVADDRDMGITHIIRGDDHLTNGVRQTLIYRALGWDVPAFAHVPLIHGPDGAKLSKRHGALGVEAYRKMGFLPEGLRNYLLRLGWSHGDQELFSDEEAIAAFGLDGLNKAPARLDFAKMESVNGHWMKQADDQRLTSLFLDWLAAETGERPDAETAARIARAMPVLKTRAQTIAALDAQTQFIRAARPLQLDGKSEKTLDAEARSRLKRLSQMLEDIDLWDAQRLHDAVQHFVEDEAIGFGKIGQPLRAALTAGAPAPDLGQVLAILGREESLARIGDQATA